MNQEQAIEKIKHYGEQFKQQLESYLHDKFPITVKTDCYNIEKKLGDHFKTDLTHVTLGAKLIHHIQFECFETMLDAFFVNVTQQIMSLLKPFEGQILILRRSPDYFYQFKEINFDYGDAVNVEFSTRLTVDNITFNRYAKNFNNGLICKNEGEPFTALVLDPYTVH